jgi:hypothetical protein
MWGLTGLLGLWDGAKKTVNLSFTMSRAPAKYFASAVEPCWALLVLYNHGGLYSMYKSHRSRFAVSLGCDGLVLLMT